MILKMLALALRVVSAAIGVAGILLNVLVLIVLNKKTGIVNVNVTNLLLHQSFVDLFASSFILVYQFVGVTVSGNIPGQADDSIKNIICKLFWNGFPYWSLVTLSTFNMVLLNFDRYLSVVHAVFYHQHVKFLRRASLVIIVLCWPVGFAMNLDNIFIYTYQFDSNTCLYTSFTEPDVAVTVALAYFFIRFMAPLILLSFFYVRIIRVLRTRNENAKQGSNQNRKIVTVCIMTGVLFFLCYVWDQVNWMLYQIQGLSGHDMNEPWYIFCVLMSLINVLVNPILYVIILERFRKATTEIFLSDHRQRHCAYNAKAGSYTLTPVHIPSDLPSLEQSRF